MHTTKFLESVAQYYMSRSSDHRHTLLLFPNKRSIMFMRRYLKRQAAESAFMPRMQTLGAFIASLSPLKEASFLDQLFTLYEAYYETIYALDNGQLPLPFDKFRNRGETMLGDFEDVDAQMVDAKAVFVNVQRLEEIQTYFLEEDQRAVARELFGYDPAQFEGFRNNHKKRINPDGEEDIVYEGFVRMSEMLYPIYERFHALLTEQNLTTRGMLLRTTADTLDVMIDSAQLRDIRFGLVGFGTLGKAERQIFKTLKKAGRADFFWDIPDMLKRDISAEMRSFATPLSGYIDRIVRYFTMPADYELPKVEYRPEIKIIGVPANTLQAKVAGNILNEIKDILRPNRIDDTAIVLPDASLLTPLLHSIEISPVNVTMGVPVRNTPFATFLSLIIRLNRNGRRDDEGVVIYLTDNVRQILSNPSMTLLLAEPSARLAEYLERNPRYVITYKTIVQIAPELEFVFRPVGGQATAGEARSFLDDLIDGLTEKCKDIAGGVEKSKLHEFKILSAMRKAIDSLVDAIERHPILHVDDMMSSLSFFILIERILRKEQLNFTGSPLKGIQIMGVLETRSLDFDNVIMLSLNEKTFPPRNFMKSILPSAIRNYYGLSTTELHELQYAWIYANLLSRSRRAYLVYDASAQTSGKGGMSRYLFQTRYLFNLTAPQVVNILPGGHIEPPEGITVHKTKAIMDALDRYREGGTSYLSASALKTYASCPLHFYLSKVERVSQPVVVEPSINEALLGSIVHKIFEDKYNEILSERDGLVDATVVVSPKMIEEKMADLLNKNWYNSRFKKMEDMPPEATTQIQYWTKQIVKVFETETRERIPYHVVSSEMSPTVLDGVQAFPLKINDDLTIRFTFLIDRVDRTDDGSLRFIDYKTGNDPLKAANMDVLFSRDEKGADGKAIFQLLTYAHAYRSIMKLIGTPYDGDISLEITSLQAPTLSIGKPLQVGDDIAQGQGEMFDAFVEQFNDMVAEIFDPAVPFRQAKNDAHCKYCQFKEMCGRNVEEQF